MEKITFRIPESQADELDKLVNSGMYPNRSEVIRSAIRSKIAEEKQLNQTAQNQ